MPALFKKMAALILLLIVLKDGRSQYGNCVNYDERYPITTSTGKKYLWNPTWNFYNMKLRRVSNLNISNGMFRGLMEYLPPSYNLAANATKKYPVIIFFHGYASRGLGSALELCRLFKDRGADSAGQKNLPGRLERSVGNFTQAYGGTTYEYIFIAPQFTQYTRLQPGVPDKFPSAKEVEDVINYVVSRYRIDPRRIYLTGYSNGANMVIEYVGSSLARARRVAAVMPVSLCSQLGHINNTSRGIFAKYIGEAKLKTWFVFCESDNCGSGPALLVPNKWVDSIRKVPGYYPPRYTRLRNIDPPTLYNCSDSLWHDAWSRAFDPNFKTSFAYTPTGAVGANDGINLNMYQWFIRQVAPATTTSASELDPAGLGGTEPGSSITVTPNPFTSGVSAFISLPRPQRVSVTLTDLSGRQIQVINGFYAQGNSEVKLSSERLASGIYLVKVAGENFSKIHKIVKQ